MHALPQRFRFGLIAGLCVSAAAPASAETTAVADTGFTITVQREISLPPARVFQTLAHVDRWWNPEHTWSGKAANLSLRLEAGACFCERWAGGTVEHGRVIAAMHGRLLRLQAPLGPLQSMPVSAVLSFETREQQGHTMLRVTYAIADAAGGLAELAPAVDKVITEQVDRLARFAVAGRPE